MDPETLGTVVDLVAKVVPAAAAPHVVTGLAVVGAASAAGKAAKPLLGEPKPTDKRWKRILFRVLHAFDFLALNSAPLKDKLAAAHSVPPPARKGPPPVPGAKP